MAEVPRREVENIEFIYEIMGSKTEGLDAFDLADALRCLNLNPTLSLIEKMGGTTKKNEKKILIADFIPIYAQVKAEKEQGCYEDFLECLKLYDKDENGLMTLTELTYALLNLGDPLTDEQCDELFADCLGEEDDEGMIKYSPFLAKMCNKNLEE